MKSILRILLTAVVAAIYSVTSAQAATCYAVDEGNMIYRFSSTTPGLTASRAISNLPIGYRIVGLDFRTTMRGGGANPGPGSLWALGTDGSNLKLFTINLSTAAANFIGNLSDINTSGIDNGWGFGFDPATDTLRVMNFIYNYSVNPNTLAVTEQTQFDVAHNQGLNPWGFPALNGAAYTTAPFGGSSRIYFLEQQNEGVNTSANISTGAYSALPIPAVPPAFNQTDGAGLDIVGSVFLMSCWDYSVHRQRLFSVTTSGAFILIGDISDQPITLRLRSLAIQPTSFPAPLPVTVKVKGKKKATTTAATLKIKGSASSAVGIQSVRYKVGNKGFKPATGTTSWSFKVRLKPGTNKVIVEAVGGNGAASAPAKITIERQ